ncbi:MAG: hypothetical protein ACFFFO_05745 [Candidatus Thorarchaeota archaeon]
MVEKKVLKKIEARLVKLNDDIISTIEKPIHFTNYFHSEEGGGDPPPID